MKVTTICYKQPKMWNSKSAAIKFYQEGIMNSEGCERERYIAIVEKLNMGFTIANDDINNFNKNLQAI